MTPQPHTKFNLDFLNDIKIPESLDGSQPSWLESDFYDNKWLIRHEHTFIRHFDWHRLLPNGLFLTSNGVDTRATDSRINTGTDLIHHPKYRRDNDLRIVLNRLKRLVILFRHRRISRTCGFSHHYGFFIWILDLTEWVFLHENVFKPRTHLFSLLDSNDLERGFLLPMARGGKAELFDYENRFVATLRRILDAIPGDLEKQQLIAKSKDDGIQVEFESPFAPTLPLRHSEIVTLRAWLYCHGFCIGAGRYRGKLKSESFFRDRVKLDIKADSVSDTLQAMFRALSAVERQEILEFSPSNVKEFLPAGETSLRERIQAGNKRATSEREIASNALILTKLTHMCRFSNDGLPPASVLSSVDLSCLHQLQLAPKGRTKTIPVNVAMHALGHAVRFIVNCGDDLVDYAIALKAECERLRNVSAASGYEKQNASYYSDCVISNVPLPSSLAPLNITQLTSIFKNKGLEQFSASGGNGKTSVMRQYMGIADALTLLIASTIVIIGTTAARRRIEIIDLSENCLESIIGAGWYLRFGLGKNVFGMVRGELSRCIPNVAAHAIMQMKKLNAAWRRFHGNESSLLFSGFALTFDKSTQLSDSTFTRALDIFCDYVQIPLDQQGKRWYIRAHQLRRFWAYTFFYKFGLSDLCTIGWYLGHADAEQTWMYILESFDGHDEELIKIKAAYAADVLHRGGDPDGDISSSIHYIQLLIRQHFQRSDFVLIEEEDLLAYLESLIAEGVFDITPEFFTGTDENDYKMVWLINEKNPT